MELLQVYFNVTVSADLRLFLCRTFLGDGPPGSLALSAFSLFQILSNSAGQVVLLDLAELFK